MVQRAKNWSIAIGLQQVDGLTPSDFLVSQAKENIEGKISTEDVRHRLEEYYQQKDVREKAEADRTLEADGVSERINALLAQKAFTFSPYGVGTYPRLSFQGYYTSRRIVLHI